MVNDVGHVHLGRVAGNTVSPYGRWQTACNSEVCTQRTHLTVVRHSFTSCIFGWERNWKCLLDSHRSVLHGSCLVCVSDVNTGQNFGQLLPLWMTTCVQPGLFICPWMYGHRADQTCGSFSPIRTVCVGETDIVYDLVPTVCMCVCVMFLLRQ